MLKEVKHNSIVLSKPINVFTIYVLYYNLDNKPPYISKFQFTVLLIILLTSREILPNQAKNELYTDRTYPGMFLMRMKAKIFFKKEVKNSDCGWQVDYTYTHKRFIHFHCLKWRASCIKFSLKSNKYINQTKNPCSLYLTK